MKKTELEALKDEVDRIAEKIKDDLARKPSSDNRMRDCCIWYECELRAAFSKAMELKMWLVEALERHP